MSNPVIRLSDFCEEKQLLGCDYDQAKQARAGGICDALSLYWLKRISKMQSTGRLPEKVASGSHRVISANLKLAEPAEDLKNRIALKFEKVEHIRESLDEQRRILWAWQSASAKADRAVDFFAGVKSAIDRGVPPAPGRGAPRPATGRGSLPALGDYLARRANAALDKVDEMEELAGQKGVDGDFNYDKILAATYGFAMKDRVRGDVTADDMADAMLTFILKNELVTISFWPASGVGHGMAAYRARAIQEWAFIFFDPNKGMFLCDKVDGSKFLTQWRESYQNADGTPWVHRWAITSWAPR